MKTIIALSIVLATSSVFAKTNCLQNEAQQKVCVGDVTHPWNQTVVKVNPNKGTVILREQKYDRLGEYPVDQIFVRPQEAYGYRMGQVISNPHLTLQTLDVEYEAELNKQHFPDANMKFQNTHSYWRALPNIATNAAAGALYREQAEVHGYNILLTSMGQKIEASQLNLIKAELSETDVKVKTAFKEFQVTVIEADPRLQLLVVSAEIQGQVRRLPVTKAELDLYATATSPSDFLVKCAQNSTCKGSTSWGR